MEQVFSYIIGLGAAVMMPIIFTVLGVCIGIKFSKALKSGLYVGVGFVGLSVITALLTSSLGPALSDVVRIYGLELKVFDMGWPAAASVAYNTLVGSFIIPVCLGVNLVLLYRLASTQISELLVQKLPIECRRVVVRKICVVVFALRRSVSFYGSINWNLTASPN